MNRILLFFSLLIFTSCNNRGEIIDQPADFIEIHGKVYKLMRIQPSGYAFDRAIWIMYPKDSTDAMPTSINYEVTENKTNKIETVIKVD